MRPPTESSTLQTTLTQRPSAWRRWRDQLLLQEDLNFLLTNRIPRIFVTRAMGRLSRIRHRTWTRCCLYLWRAFTDLDLSEAAPSHYESIHDCFTRALKPGARPIDPSPSIMVSPCDAIVGACGRVDQSTVYQAKGFPYSIEDLFGNANDAAPYTHGTYVTLRLTSSMYHRFHAPEAGVIQRVNYISGDTWNVNPIALKRVERLFCRNERAVVHMSVNEKHPIAMVAVAAVMVASIQLHFVPVHLHLRYKGPNLIPCAVAVSRGQELGWFEHGSTIVVFAPGSFKLAPGIETGATIRMGRPLFQYSAN